jgi:hypothetical protein
MRKGLSSLPLLMPFPLPEVNSIDIFMYKNFSSWEERKGSV